MNIFISLLLRNTLIYRKLMKWQNNFCLFWLSLFKHSIQFKHLYWHIHYIIKEEQEILVQWHGFSRILPHTIMILSYPTKCSTWLIICQKDEKPIQVYEPWIRDNKESLFRKQVQVRRVHNKLDNILGTLSWKHNIWYIAYMNNVNTITHIGTLDYHNKANHYFDTDIH